MRKMASGAYSQEKMMADTSMDRTLFYQTEAIWPKERVVFQAMGLHRKRRIADLGCGTGEFEARLVENYTFEEISGIDLLGKSIETARKRLGRHANLKFVVGDAKRTPFPDDHYDVTLNRHVLQSIPAPQDLILEMKRVTKPGGILYFLVEDYGMIHCTNHEGEPFWHRVSQGILPQGTDLMIGRKLPFLLHELGFKNMRREYLTVDTLNTDRQVLAGIFHHWKLGYQSFLAQHNHLPESRVARHFQDHIDCCLDPTEYLVWHVPIIAVQKDE